MVENNAIIFSLIILMLLIVVALVIYSNLKKNPNKLESIKDLYAEGLDMMVTGKRKSAYRNFKAIINRDSSNIKAYLHLGQVLRESGKIENALKIHNNLLFRTDLTQYEKIELYKNLVFNYEKLNNDIEAINYCIKIIEIEKNNDWAIKYIIKLYKNKDDWTNAIKYLKVYFEKNNTVDSDMLALYEIQRGRSILRDNNFDEARAIFERALELNGELYIIYYFIGNTYKSESNFKFNQAIELAESGNPSSLKNEELIENYKNEAQKLLNKAISMWVHFIDNMPAYSWIILPTLKDALQALDRYGDIESILIKVKNKNSGNIDIISHLADYYANKGEVDKALETINIGIDKNKDSLIAQLKRIKIKSLITKQLDLSVEVDKLIQSLLRDDRYKKFKYNFSDNNLNWLFKYDNGIYED